MAPMTMLAAVAQTAGRGQRGNSWEATPGKNLTFSLLYHPGLLLPARQFAISEAVALAITDVLAGYGIRAKVKWPNDIYVGDNKICGILIDHALCGARIMHTVISAGLNVNQETFVSDAPNPVSMRQLTGADYDLQEVAEATGAALERRLAVITSWRPGEDYGLAALHSEFMAALYRNDGELHAFTDTATGEEFEARIADVASDGILTLETSGGVRRRYTFKEVGFRY